MVATEERDFRSAKNVVKAEIRTELKKRVKVCTILGLDDDSRTLEEQIYALSAAKASVDYGIPVAETAKIAGVSQATVYEYIKKLGNIKSDQSFLSILVRRGRPTKYDRVVDAAFVLWLEDPKRTFREKMKCTLPDVYRRISTNLGRTVPESTDAALAKHCERLYKRLGYTVRKPKLVEAKRCAIWDTLVEWYSDKEIMRILKSAHPALVFNLDETHLTPNQNLWDDC